MFNNANIFYKIKNAGDKTFEEFKVFKITLSDLVLDIQNLNSDNLTRENLKLTLQYLFLNIDNYFLTNINDFFDENNKIKLFSIIDKLLNAKLILKKEFELRVFKFTYTNNNDDINKILSDFKYTKERIRQIRVNKNNQLKEYFSFIHNQFFLENIIYYFDNSDNFIILDNSITEKINVNECVNFKNNFYTEFFGLILESTHTCIGLKSLINGTNRNTKTKKEFKYSYFISNNLIDFFDFNKFIENIYLRSIGNRKESYSLNFKGFLYDFQKQNFFPFFDEIHEICKKIIFKEFDLLLENDDYLTFQSTKKIPLSKQCYQILDEHSKPMNLTEIVKALKIKHSEIDISENKLRSHLKKSNGSFIYFGRSSSYGLKKWENEKLNIKGGTISEIVEEFLQEVNEPQHISKILEYVLCYRPHTNERSVSTILKVDTIQRFLFFRGSYFGLKSKNYDVNKNNFKKLSGLHFSRNELSKYNYWYLDDLINFYCTKFGYLKEQVEFVLKQKINERIIKLTLDKKIII